MNNEKKEILKIQKNEITEHFIYKKLATRMRDQKNREVLKTISQEELKHYEFFKKISQTDVKPDYFKINFYVLISRVFGLTFGVKLMESKEDSAQVNYTKLKESIPNIEEVIADEDRHENELVNLIDEDRLKYVSSIVLGLNDALVELTGALAGFTLALQDPKLIAVVGLITGIAASMSMAASEYLSTKQEENSGKSPVKASVYTGIAYVMTVFILILPYLIFKNVFISLSFLGINAIIIITMFTYYISVAKELSFRKRFLEMAGLSLTIAVINFFIGWAIKGIFGVDL